MLVIVLCRFSVHFGKYFPKKTQHDSLYCLGRKWLNSCCAYVAAIRNSVSCCRSDSREKLILAMLQGSGPANVPGLETKSAVNFFSKRQKARIIPLPRNKASSRIRFQPNEEDQNLLLKRQEALTQIATNLGGVA